MGRVAKKKRSDARKALKKARKTSNYLRFGPKQGHSGRRQKRKRYGTFKPGFSSSDNQSPTPPGRKARRRRAGLSPIPKSSGGGRAHSNFPLRSLRKRRRIGSARSEKAASGE